MAAKVHSRTFDTLVCLILLVVIPVLGQTLLRPADFLGYVSAPVSDHGADLSALVQVEGAFGTPGHHKWRASRKSDDCGGTKFIDYFDVEELIINSFDENDIGGGEVDDERETRTLQVFLPKDHNTWLGETTLFLCSETKTFKFGGEVIKWTPMGMISSFTLSPPTSEYILNEENKLQSRAAKEEDQFPYFDDGSESLSRHLRALDNDVDNSLDYDSKENITTLETEIISHSRILAILLDEVTKYISYGDDGVINIRQGREAHLFVYGIGLTNDSEVKLTSSIASTGHACKSHGLHVQTTSFPLNVNDSGTFGKLVIPAGTLPAMKAREILYACLKTGKNSPFVHQGTSKSVQIVVYDLLLPIWLMIIFILVLLSMSGLFSGLNLGLMALDQTELKIVQNTGSDREKGYANKISPIRAHGNFLLCSLLLGNVLVNNTLTILLDTLTSGIVAIIGATIAIVIFGEIVPQAICSRHGLAVGAHTIWLTKFFMLITCPLAYPISKILDKILGAEIGTVYDKKRLIELLRVTRDKNDLEKEEVDIVTGALAYKEKTVKSVMTPLRDAYLLSCKTILDFETIAEIREQGYSRIPVFDGERTNIVYVLFVKDLMFIDPNDNTPVAVVCEYYKNDVNFVFHDTPLNVMFKEFKSGEKGHMAFVQDVNTSGEGDPFYETIGLITLEDIIEEIIQQEIIDEADIIKYKRLKQSRLKNGKVIGEFPIFNEQQRKVNVTPQLSLAVFQYLTATVEPFKAEHISDFVLKKLLALDVYREIKIKKNQTNEEDLIIIEKGKPTDYFVLIVEGRVQANIGKEELVFESGPFSFYGLQVLTQVLDNPPSPMMGHKPTTPQSVLGAAADAFRNSSLKKTSTQISFDVPHILNRRASNITGQTLQENTGSSLSRQGSAIFTFSFTPFIPDYTVKAVSDVTYLRIKRTVYLRALKATVMHKKPSPSEQELERYLERVNEDDDTFYPTPKMSPEKYSGNILERAASFVSGRLTPTLSMRSGADRSSGHGKRSSINTSFHNFDSEKDKTEDATVEEEDEDEEEGEFWNGGKGSSNVTTPSPMKSSTAISSANGPTDPLHDSPEKESLDSKKDPETNGTRTAPGSAPGSAGAIIISVRSNSTEGSENNQTDAEQRTTTNNVLPNGGSANVS